MNSLALKISFAVIVLIQTAATAAGQTDSLLPMLYKDKSMRDFAILSDIFSRPIDINRLPIHICFLKQNEQYMGFVIAGHAFHNVCRSASLRIQTFIDSLGDAENTLFSFGVGFDFRNPTEDYSDHLKEVEETFRELERQNFEQVNVSYVQDSVFQKLMANIRRNRELAYTAMQNNDTINRVIFRYNNVQFPVPVEFYQDDSIINFRIPKSELMPIPDIRGYESSILKEAILDLENKIKINSIALERLNTYSPTISYEGHLRREDSRYPLKISTGLEIIDLTDKFRQFDPNKIVEEYDLNSGETKRFYSISDLEAMCRNGQTQMTLKLVRGDSKINTCEAAKSAEEQIRIMNDQKDETISFVTRINKFLVEEKRKVSLLKASVDKLDKKETQKSQLEVDAFLRGWPFNSGDTVINKELDNWYSKRTVVWRHILGKNSAYKERFKLKKDAIDDTDNIAGIFQSDDVFFAVKEYGSEYIVTPYKMLSGDFVQVVDKKNKISQFFSMNNFRLLQL